MGDGEKIKLQKKTEIRAEKGQTKKVNLGWHRDREENPISAPFIDVGVPVGVVQSGPIAINVLEPGAFNPESQYSIPLFNKIS